MIIQVLPSGPLATNAYVVACPETRQAAIIDPAPESFEMICDYLAEYQYVPVKLLLTHSHWDHIADVKMVKEKYHLPVYIHSNDASNLIKPGSDGIPCWISIDGVKPDHLIAEGDVIEVGDLSFRVIHTPGHTPGGVCFYNKTQGVLISGDTLFQGSIGNISLPTSNPKLMWESMKKLAKLPPETRVFPGHGPSTTIGDEEWLPNAEQFFGN